VAGRLIVVSGTGTGIGKTHFAEALLLALRETGRRVVGLKPVESGVVPGSEGDSDSARLSRASSFHVKHEAAVFPDPVSPHLAARWRGVTLQAEALEAPLQAARIQADAVVAELPGGLFTPLAPDLLNADLAARLRPDALLLVAPDRLGVLHDVTATARAASAMSLDLTAIVLMAPEEPDRSTGLNAPELPPLVSIPVFGPLPRASSGDLARSRELQIILQRLAR
jgi:dethiobiotin synthetase